MSYPRQSLKYHEWCNYSFQRFNHFFLLLNTTLNRNTESQPDCRFLLSYYWFHSSINFPALSSNYSNSWNQYEHIGDLHHLYSLLSPYNQQFQQLSFCNTCPCLTTAFFSATVVSIPTKASLSRSIGCITQSKLQCPGRWFSKIQRWTRKATYLWQWVHFRICRLNTLYYIPIVIVKNYKTPFIYTHFYLMFVYWAFNVWVCDQYLSQ